MKKTNFTLFIFLLLGLLTGSIAGQLLLQVEWLDFLTKSVSISWQPRADLDIVKYDLLFEVKISLISILGVVGAFWVYRRM